MSWIKNLDLLENIGRLHNKNMRLKPKKSKIWNIFPNYATTIGNTVYIPEDWSFTSVRHILAHEAGHVSQFKVFGFGIHPNIGIPLFFIVYGLLFLPIFLAWPRYRLELHAETQSWKHALKMKLSSPEQIMSRANSFAKTVSGKGYFFAVPKLWSVWGFMRRAKKMIRKYK